MREAGNIFLMLLKWNLAAIFQKYYVDVHENEEIDDVRFGIKIRSTARTAFERQVGDLQGVH